MSNQKMQKVGIYIDGLFEKDHQFMIEMFNISERRSILFNKYLIHETFSTDEQDSIMSLIESIFSEETIKNILLPAFEADPEYCELFNKLSQVSSEKFEENTINAMHSMVTVSPDNALFKILGDKDQLASRIGICFTCKLKVSELSEQKQLSVCSRCHATYYCCKECQVKDWKNHKKLCRS